MYHNQRNLTLSTYTTSRAHFSPQFWFLSAECRHGDSMCHCSNKALPHRCRMVSPNLYKRNSPDDGSWSPIVSPSLPFLPPAVHTSRSNISSSSHDNSTQLHIMMVSLTNPLVYFHAFIIITPLPSPPPPPHHDNVNVMLVVIVLLTVIPLYSLLPALLPPDLHINPRELDSYISPPFRSIPGRDLYPLYNVCHCAC